MTQQDEPSLHPHRGASPQTPPTSDDTAERPPPGVHAMALFRWALIALMALIAVLSVAYSFDLVSPRNAGAATAQYYCPMHPQIVQDGPGECPICSMSLVAKPGADEREPQKSSGREQSPPVSPAPTAPPAARQGVPGLVPVELALERTQLIGVRTAVVAEEELVAELRTVGFIAADESRIARVHTRFSGWVERLAASTTGQKVTLGEVLASIYNPDLLPAQQEFLTALRWKGESTLASRGSLAQDARERLELLGMSARELDRIAESGKPTKSIDITAPMGGYIVRKAAVQGAYVQPGTELFEIADLSRVWVLADIYEHEIGRVRVGQTARIELNSVPGSATSGKVSFIYPALETQSRTLRVRIELANGNMALLPGMYGNVVIQLDRARGVVIPSEALVDTGEYQYVFVARDAGRFEPRRVRAGERSGSKVQIREGLAAGETVVTTANFLIDSESRLRAAVEGPP
jgi:membrane fusion protein, copper/silver efflux system